MMMLRYFPTLGTIFFSTPPSSLIFLSFFFFASYIAYCTHGTIIVQHCSISDQSWSQWCNSGNSDRGTITTYRKNKLVAVFMEPNIWRKQSHSAGIILIISYTSKWKADHGRWMKDGNISSLDCCYNHNPRYWKQQRYFMRKAIAIVSYHFCCASWFITSIIYLPTSIHTQKPKKKQ